MSYQGVYHLDLKADNIMMKDGTPKIGDLGTSVISEDGMTVATYGTTQYAAPEAIACALVRSTSLACLYHNVVGYAHFNRDCVTLH